VRRAFYTYSYTDRLGLDIDRTLAEIARWGYEGIDESSTAGPHVNSSSVTPARRRAIRDAARRHGLRVEAIVSHAELSTSLFSSEPLDLIAALDLAAELEGELVTFHLGGAVPHVPLRDVWQRTVAALREALASADSRHLRLAIDLGPWPTWLVTTSDQLQQLFDDVGSSTLGINYDPSYLAVQGIDPLGFLRRFAPRVCHAHLKDHRGRYPHWEHHIPGRGELDYVPLVRELARQRFAGSLAIECFTDMPLSTACEVGYNTLSVALRQIPADLPAPR
jgi:sugar phosphate isomerase/epimerase